MSTIVDIHGVPTKQIVDDTPPVDPDSPEAFEGTPKTSAWTDADRVKDEREGKEKPKWWDQFKQGDYFCVNGYMCRILQIGNAGGKWMVLMEPQAPVNRETRRKATAKGKKRAHNRG